MGSASGPGRALLAAGCARALRAAGASGSPSRSAWPAGPRRSRCWSAGPGSGWVRLLRTVAGAPGGRRASLLRRGQSRGRPGAGRPRPPRRVVPAAPARTRGCSRAARAPGSGLLAGRTDTPSARGPIGAGRSPEPPGPLPCGCGGLEDVRRVTLQRPRLLAFGPVAPAGLGAAGGAGRAASSRPGWQRALLPHTRPWFRPWVFHAHVGFLSCHS